MNLLSRRKRKKKKQRVSRETREGWPLPTVETGVNRDSKSTQERVPSMVGSVSLLCRCKRFLFCLGCSSTNMFFPHGTLFKFLCSPWPASGTGSRAGSSVS
jgi:hypothetical protein